MGSVISTISKNSGMIVMGAVSMVFYKIAESVVTVGKKIFEHILFACEDPIRTKR